MVLEGNRGEKKNTKCESVSSPSAHYPNPCHLIKRLVFCSDRGIAVLSFLDIHFYKSCC